MLPPQSGTDDDDDIKSFTVVFDANFDAALHGTASFKAAVGAAIAEALGVPAGAVTVASVRSGSIIIAGTVDSSLAFGGEGVDVAGLATAEGKPAARPQTVTLRQFNLKNDMGGKSEQDAQRKQ